MAMFRIDHWAAALPEKTLWEIYYRIKSMRWMDAAELVVREYGAQRQPGRNSIYEFKCRMREEESAHRMAEVAVAQAEAAALAKGRSLSDEDTEAAYKQLATELVLRTGSAKDAKPLVEMAAAIADRRQRDAELALKEKAQATKDEQLKLAREKFEAAEKRLERVAEIADAARGGKVDPAKVADEIDRILGRKK